MTYSQYPRLATPADLPRLVTQDRVSHAWPPAGTTVELLGFPETWPLVVGLPEGGEPGDWWVSNLGNVTGFEDSLLEEFFARVGGIAAGPVWATIGRLSDWPVIYEYPEVTVMRWIASVCRGTLGTQEQFQFGINWGNPGNDPDPNEAETLAFAGTLRDEWQAAMATMQSFGPALISIFPDEVKFVEWGATVKTQTTPTGSDGTGGDLEQKFETQYAAYNPASQPTGGGTQPLPFEVACAITLQTDTRGPRGRGRVYMPPFATGAMGNDGLFDNAYPGTAAKALGEFFDAVTLASGYVPLVVSRRAVQLHEVTSINAGLVPDSQRRRRRSQDELRVTHWTAA